MKFNGMYHWIMVVNGDEWWYNVNSGLINYGLWKLWGYPPNSHNMIHKFGTPQLNSRLGVMNPGLTWNPSTSSLYPLNQANSSPFVNPITNQRNKCINNFHEIMICLGENTVCRMVSSSKIPSKSPDFLLYIPIFHQKSATNHHFSR
jgi:hypothetical protein